MEVSEDSAKEWIRRSVMILSRALFLIFPLIFASCSTFSKPPGGLGIPHLENQSSSTRPIWIDSLGRWQVQHSDREYFVGATSKEPDQESGRTDAYENAMRSIAERIGQRANSLYQEQTTRNMEMGSQGLSMNTQRRVHSVVMTQAQARISGARVEDYYWQKFWEKDKKNEPPYSFYKYHILVSLRKDLYERLLRQSLSGARDSVQDQKLKTLLDKMLKQEASASQD